LISDRVETLSQRIISHRPLSRFIQIDRLVNVLSGTGSQMSSWFYLPHARYTIFIAADPPGAARSFEIVDGVAWRKLSHQLDHPGRPQLDDVLGGDAESVAITIGAARTDHAAPGSEPKLRGSQERATTRWTSGLVVSSSEGGLPSSVCANSSLLYEPPMDTPCPGITKLPAKRRLPWSESAEHRDGHRLRMGAGHQATDRFERWRHPLVLSEGGVLPP